MPNALKGLLAGFAQGNATNAARDKAAQAAQIANRKHALAIAGESRLVQKAAEDAFGEMESMVSSPDWDPVMSMSLLQKARRFDQTYGGAWKGGSAQSHFAKKLHLTDIGPETQGKQGPSSPAEARGGRLSGFTSPLQKEVHNQKMEGFEKERQLEGLQLNGMEFLNQFATDDQGILDPNKVGLAMLQWESQAMASGNYDVQDMMAVTKAMRDNLQPIMDEMLANDPNSAAYKEVRNQRSKDTSAWVKTQFQKVNDFGISAGFDDKSEQIRNVVEEHGQQLVMLGYDMPVIKAELLQRFTVDQKWVIPGVGEAPVKITPHQQSLAAMPVDHRAEVQRIYDEGYMGQPIDPSRWEPAHNQKTGETVLISQIEGLEIPVTGPTSSIQGLSPAEVLGGQPAPTVQQEAAPKEQEPQKEKKPIDVSVGSANQQVRDFFGKLSDADKKARGQTPEMRAKLAQEAAEASLLADAKEIRSKK